MEIEVLAYVTDPSARVALEIYPLESFQVTVNQKYYISWTLGVWVALWFIDRILS